jgi:hypothetical protein
MAFSLIKQRAKFISSLVVVVVVVVVVVRWFWIQNIDFEFWLLLVVNSLLNDIK